MPDDPVPRTRAALQAAHQALSTRLAAVRCQVRQLTAQATTQAVLIDESARLAFAVQVDACAAEVQQILAREAALRRALILLQVSEHPARDWRDDGPKEISHQKERETRWDSQRPCSRMPRSSSIVGTRVLFCQRWRLPASN
jgi:hypothetical protein